MRTSGRFQPKWDLIYHNAGDNVTGSFVGQGYPDTDPRHFEYLDWSTDGSSITCYETTSSVDSGRGLGGLVVDSDRSFPQATRIKFDVKPSNTYSALLGAGWGSGPEAWSQRDPGFAVVAGYNVYESGQGNPLGLVRIEDYYRGDTVQQFNVSFPLSGDYPSAQSYWFTVRAVCFGRFATIKVTGATLPRPLYAMGGMDSNLVAHRLRLAASPAMRFGQTPTYATRIKNISVWTMDLLGELPS